MSNMPTMAKSTRHSKIIGNCGENVICDWLSKSGFEVAIVDHTGIDLIAYDPKNKQRLGITVKSRTRTDEDKNNNHSVNLWSNKKGTTSGREKLEEACKAFGCSPWIGIFVETDRGADIYLTPLKNYDDKRRSKRNVTEDTWYMSKEAKDLYRKDDEVKHVRMTYEEVDWF